MVLMLLVLFGVLLSCVSGQGCNPCSTTYPRIVQSIPVGMKGSVNLTSTTDGWLQMLASAQQNVSINAFYVTLTQGARDWPAEAGGALGQSVFDAIVACVKRGVRVRLIVGWPAMDEQGAEDPAALEAVGVEVRRLNWTAATGLKGVLHSKFMIIDQSSAYIGSANFDWRSLSQVKELGIVISNCSALTNDVMLLFEQHWALALPNATVPNQWDVKYWPEYNSNSPLLMQVDNQKVAGFVAVSPPSLCPPTRTSDTDAILDMFRNANRFARLAVMEYSNFFLYEKPTTIWPRLDNEMRLAALRGVNISFIIASWEHTDLATIPYLQSLDVLPNIDVRVFTVPKWTTANGTSIPYTRVDHAKYIITDNGYYISTSNWTPDYFLATSGISLTMISNSDNWKDMDASFNADWTSNYTLPLFAKYPPLFIE